MTANSHQRLDSLSSAASRLAETYREAATWRQCAVLALPLAVFAFAQTPVIWVGAAILLGALFYLRLDLGLRLIVLAIPFAFTYKPIGADIYSPPEILTTACFGAWVAQRVWLAGAPGGMPGAKAPRLRKWKPPEGGWRWIKDTWRGLSALDRGVLAFVCMALLSLVIAEDQGAAQWEVRILVIEPALVYVMVRGLRFTPDARHARPTGHRLKPTPDMENPLKRVDPGGRPEPVSTGLAYQPPNSFGASIGALADALTAGALIAIGHRLKPTPDMENPLKRVGTGGCPEPVSTGLAYQPPNSFGASIGALADALTAGALSAIGHRLKPTPDTENPLKRVGTGGRPEPVSTGLAYQPPNSFGASIGTLADALTAGALIVAVVGLYQYFLTDYVESVQGVRRILSIYDSPNHVSLFLGRVAPISFCLAAFGVTRWRRVYHAAALLPILLCLYLTYSRGAWLLGLPATLIFIGVMRGRRARIAAAGALIVALLALAPILRTPRIASLLTLESGTNYHRLLLWEGTARMIAANPILGVGLGNFMRHYPRHMLREAGHEPVVFHPHNLLLDTWTSMGLVGVAALAFVLIAFFRAGLSAYRRLYEERERQVLRVRERISSAAGSVGDRTPRRSGRRPEQGRLHEARELQALTLGLLAGMVSFGAHGLVDTGFRLTDLAFVFMLTLGMIRQITARDLPR